MTELRICISEIWDNVLFLFDLFILLQKRVSLNNRKCKADGGEENFFYDHSFPEGSCSKLFKGLECLKNSQGKEIDRESTDETAKG